MSPRFIRTESNQMILPFAEKEYVSVQRVANILGVGISTVYRLAETKDRGGRGLLDLVNYRNNGRKRVLYSSVVRFCDNLRLKYGIPDRRTTLDAPWFRHKDVDLLPFPLSDTIYTDEVQNALGYESRKPVFNLLEEGKFEGYQIFSESTWRVSRTSFVAFLQNALGHEITILSVIPADASKSTAPAR